MGGEGDLHCPGEQRTPTSRSWEQVAKSGVVVEQLPINSKLMKEENLSGHAVSMGPVPDPYAPP